MTCVWDSIIQSLTYEERALIFKNNCHNANSLAIWFKENNRPTKNVIWNKDKLHKNQIKEGIEWINNIDPNQIYNGYDCSICDPLLLLLCELLEIKIEHIYTGFIMFYENIRNNKRTVMFKSDGGHFSFIGTK